jgi:YggT family protein
MWSIVAGLLNLFLLCLFGRAVLSWFPSSGDGPMATVRSVLFTITEPVLAPVRRLLPPARIGGMGLDLSFMIVVLAIILLQGFLPR